MPSRLLSILLLASAGAAAAFAETSPGFVCRGHEPSWSLRVEASAATLTRLGGDRLALAGQLRDEPGGRAFVFRGSTAGQGDVVALITTESCTDTMADAAEGGGESPFTGRVSLATGEALRGCCRRAPAASAPTPLPPSSGPTAAASQVTGEIAALSLPDGRVCRSMGKGATLALAGKRLNFDCGTSGVDKLGLVGPLAARPDRLLVGEQSVIEWRDGAHSLRAAEAVPVRVAEIALSDGSTCRFAGTGATLAFSGRRASYTCGMQGGATLALLGELEPAEGGYRIVRARITHGDAGFTLRSEETIVVRAPH